MRNLWKSLLALSLIGMGLAMSAPTLAATNAVGPYYATPSWDQTLSTATRFIVLTNMNSEAVLDRETGLVWEQSPAAVPLDWYDASQRCYSLSKGGRIGWRLPSIQEIRSLYDASLVPTSLPSGHPFTIGSTVANVAFWSSTWQAVPGFTGNALTIDSFDGHVVPLDRNVSMLAVTFFSSWCVRGGPGDATQ